MFGTFDSKNLELLDSTSVLELNKVSNKNELDHRLNMITSDANECGRFSRFRTASLYVLGLVEL